MKQWKNIFNGNLIIAVIALCILLLGNYGGKNNTTSASDTSVDLLLRYAERGDLNRIASLIEAGADVNVRDAKGWTPLHAAAYRGNKATAELLIARGANLQASTVGPRGGITPLHAAASKGHRELVELLISKGARVNAATGNGKTPLTFAAGRGHREVAALLRRHGGQE